MKILRAIAIGALFWILVFVEISITMIGLKFLNLLTYIIHYTAMIPISSLCAWIYYKSKDRTNGFLLGLLITLIGIFLDMIITVPLFIIPSGGSYLSYFSEVFLIAGLIEGIVLIGIYDLIRKK